MLDPGVVLDGRYRLEELVGRGGMGEVWRATDTRLNRSVAVKALLPGQPKERFFSEARTMAALHHPGIVDVYDFGESYIVMKYVDGKPLSTLLGERFALEPAFACRLISEIAWALHAVHAAGIVHRDVTPGNILVDTAGSAHLTDFGVAMSDDTGTVLGTARYMAPEQAMGHHVTPAADIYALGAVAYHCLAGHPPFGGTDSVEIALHHVQDEPPPLPLSVPVHLGEIVATAMQKEPSQRFPDAAAMANALTLDSTLTFDPVLPPRRLGKAVATAASIGVAGILALLALNLDDLWLEPVPGPQPPAAPASTPVVSPAKSEAAPSRRLSPTPSPTRRSPSPTPGPSTPSPTPSPPPSPTSTQSPPTLYWSIMALLS